MVADGSVQSAAQATPAVPVAVGVTSPNGGKVSIADAPDSGASSGYDVVGRTFRIEAPDASVADPLRLTFRVERSLLRPPAGRPRS